MDETMTAGAPFDGPLSPPESVATARTLSALLEARVRESGSAEAVRFEGRSLTYSAVRERVLRIAAGLREMGVRPGERVALMLPNGLDFPLAWFAVPELRAIVVPVHAGYRGRDLAHVLSHSGATVALVGREQKAVVEAVRSGLPTVRRVCVLEGGDLEPEASSADKAPTEPVAHPAVPALRSEPDPSDAVTYQYTSGTTGLPKGCVLRHGYWLNLARTMQHYLKLDRTDVLLTAQPQCYMDPSWNLVLAMLVGAPLVVLPRFSASRFRAQVRDAGATFFYCIGAMPLYLLKQPPDPGLDRGHRVRLVYCSGIPARLHAEFERRWGCPWRETYGTTEMGAVLLTRSEDEASVGSGGLGQPVVGREIRIVDDVGRSVPPGSPGELLVRGQDMMLRYHDDAAATAAWCPDGWARTGDIVVQRSASVVALVGRRKDMIRRAGENIAAAEVEAVLVEHPAVRAAACVPVPDEARGEEVKAYVELTEAARLQASSALPSIHGFAAARLARFKVPRYMEIVEALPVTASGKVAKSELIGSRADHRAGSWDAEAQGRWTRSTSANA